MKVTLIAALARGRVIGINNTLPWKLSADLKRFKELTTRHTILMGRKTFESLGRPLPSRIHVCVSRGYPTDRLTPDPRWPEQVFWCGDLFSAVGLLRRDNPSPEKDVLYVIGGAEIYTQALACADTLELTHIHGDFQGDAFFPFYEDLFQRTVESAGEEAGLKYTFAAYTSRRPSNFTVRRARATDCEFIAAAQQKMALESEGLVLDATSVRRGVQAVLSDSVKGEYLIGEIEPEAGPVEPAACLLIQKEWSDWRNGNIEWMHSVYVLPEHRRKGLFRWMYRVAAARARTRGALGLRLYVDKKNTAARQTYAAVGMSEDHYTLCEDMFK